MATYFLESSALLKRYVNEVGTGFVVALTDPAAGHMLHVARITRVEIVAAIARRRKGLTLDAGAAAILLTRSRADFVNLFHVIDLGSTLIDDAAAASERHELRAYDAVQLSAAVFLNDALIAANLPPLTFVSADRELNAAAIAEGLAVEDPLRHP